MANSQLIDLLDEGFRKRAWHGTNLMGSIRGLEPDTAAWRPAPGRHNIWELIVHCAYWKYTVTRRLTGAKRGSFPYEGSNFFTRDGGTADDLRRDVRLLRRCHRDLVDAVSKVKPKDLGKRPPLGKRWTREESIRGVACHDVYHAGQIQLLKRLHES
jgi:hypothetical protein